MTTNKQGKRLSMLMDIASGLLERDDFRYFCHFIIGDLRVGGNWKVSIDVIETELYERYERLAKEKALK